MSGTWAFEELDLLYRTFDILRECRELLKCLPKLLTTLPCALGAQRVREPVGGGRGRRLAADGRGRRLAADGMREDGGGGGRRFEPGGGGGRRLEPGGAAADGILSLEGRRKGGMRGGP